MPQQVSIRFVDLIETPADLAGSGNQYVRVKSDETGIEFVSVAPGSGASTFTDLTDTPANYTGHSGKVPRVNTGETALEFVLPGDISGASTFLQLTDTPAAYAGFGGAVVTVKAGEDGLEFTPTTPDLLAELLDLYAENYTGGTKPSAMGANAIAMGESGTASGSRATVTGGQNNSASGNHATVGGGQNNSATGTAATVAGGATNSASHNSFVGGGERNDASGKDAVIAGGEDNVIQTDTQEAFIGGGKSNEILSQSVVLASSYPTGVLLPARANLGQGFAGTIASGGTVAISDDAAGNINPTTVADGDPIPAGKYLQSGGTGDVGIVATLHMPAIVGGRANTIDWQDTTIDGSLAAIAGAGSVTQALLDEAAQYRWTPHFSYIGGGRDNTVRSSFGVIGGGRDNTVTTLYGAVLGGIDNSVTGDGASAVGSYHRLTAPYAVGLGSGATDRGHFGAQVFAARPGTAGYPAVTDQGAVQSMRVIGGVTTTDATWTAIGLDDGVDLRMQRNAASAAPSYLAKLTLPDARCAFFVTARVLGRDTTVSAAHAAAYELKALVRVEASTATMPCSYSKHIVCECGPGSTPWDARLRLDGLVVELEVLGTASQTIRWGATLETVEVVL